ncbi:unnamed protein product [Rotaria magnacalcarata]|uniref:Uncharacterized protein n=1 Tax=Rotaria magnacalcarata TaxID=392030 RepID=A0A816ZJV9_9BILA|nr:unnamed protein product [Rotaria magnacalcarata]CAF1513000.1 unnamed protein product [Rotaria magnacalcarata]CAF2145537.1 unnamed protein product [Rotaria magnacalcarata]CAF2211129.1 unnamed protein product [Rotaria magnacalcarata]CAF3967239.1 unnamed protein product [Rotaria magnacalcarata]
MKLNIGLIFCGIILCCTYSISFSDPIVTNSLPTEDEFVQMLEPEQLKLWTDIRSQLYDATEKAVQDGLNINEVQNNATAGALQDFTNALEHEQRAFLRGRNLFTRLGCSVACRAISSGR